MLEFYFRMEEEEMPMRDLADHVIARAQGTGKGITNLQLQKVLYFTLINGLKNKKIDKNWVENQYDENFLVWRYGPVIKSIYEKYSNFGASKIFVPKHENDEYANLNDIIDNLLSEKTFDLVDRSHSHPRWKNNEEHIQFGRSNIPYEIEDLIDVAK